MIISKDAEKDILTKFNSHLWQQIFQKMHIDGTYLNMMKAVYEKTTASIILNVKS